MNRARRVSFLWLAVWLGACAPDPCSRRCPNDPEPDSVAVTRCRDTQSRINGATGPCATELRAFRDCTNGNTVCNSSGRAEFVTGTCSTQTSALAECCLRNIGQAPACLLR
jgi:hypothetical protein